MASGHMTEDGDGSRRWVSDPIAIVKYGTGACKITEAGDEAVVTAWFEEHLTYDTFKGWDSEDFARELLASPWLAAHDERVAREAVGKALGEVEKIQPLEHAMLCGHYGGGGCFRPSCSCHCHRYPDGVVSLTQLRKIIAAARERATDA